MVVATFVCQGFITFVKLPLQGQSPPCKEGVVQRINFHSRLILNILSICRHSTSCKNTWATNTCCHLKTYNFSKSSKYIAYFPKIGYHMRLLSYVLDGIIDRNSPFPMQLVCFTTTHLGSYFIDTLIQYLEAYKVESKGRNSIDIMLKKLDKSEYKNNT